MNTDGKRHCLIVRHYVLTRSDTLSRGIEMKEFDKIVIMEGLHHLRAACRGSPAGGRRGRHRPARVVRRAGVLRERGDGSHRPRPLNTGSGDDESARPCAR